MPVEHQSQLHAIEIVLALAWVFFLCLGIAAYGLTKADLPLAKDFRYLSTTLSWPLGAYRLMVGPSSNVAGTLLVYGSAFSNVGYFLVFVSAGTLIVVDFLRTARR